MRFETRCILFLSVLGTTSQAQSVLWHQIGPEPPSWTNTTLYPSWFHGGGDVNGDGVPDMVAAAPGGEFPLTQQGRLYVYSGLDGSIIHQIDGPHTTALLGEATLLPGDMNGDGLSEIAASVYNQGVWIYSGADAALLQILPPPSNVPCSRWYPLATIELDGDGVVDFILGCPDATPGISLTGAVAVVSGASGAPIHVWFGDVKGDRLGWSAANAGDQDGDGVDDVLAGAPHFLDELELFVGLSYARVFSGASGAVLKTLLHAPDADPAGVSMRFGYSVAGNGSLDGEGPSELLASIKVIGYPTRVFEGGTFRLAYETPQDVQHAVRVLGDVNGDGFDDFAATEVYPWSLNCLGSTTVGYTDCGRAVVFSGRDGRELFTLKPEDPHVVFGGSMAAPGDLDDDAFPDVVVSDEGWPPSEPKHKGRLTAFSLIPKGVSAQGYGCASSGAEPPRMGVTGSPVVGKALELHLSKAAAGVPALLALGVSDTLWGTTSLPLDLAAAGLPGCSILIAPAALAAVVTQPADPAPGRATVGLKMPQSATLVGMQFFAQWYVGGPSPAFTRALRFELLQASP